ncbi:MAG: hypothetical protein GX387_07990 [Clostridium sp.]|jgi:hypothetical protein|nr:hypothetical protein [Clostridium sp.]
MGYVKERVAYLKGLFAGMNIDESTNEGKLFKEIIEVLGDIADSVSDIEEVQEHLEEQVDTIDEDLGEVERLLYDDCDCGYEDDELIAEIQCPHCHEIVELTEDMLDTEEDSFKCTACGKDIIVEWDCDCDECSDECDEI